MPLFANRIAGAAARIAGLLLAGLLLGRGATAQAASHEVSGADEPIVAFVPEEAVAVLVAEAPGAALAALLEALGPVPEGLPAPLAARVGAGLAVLAVAFGGSPVALAERLGGGGLALAFVPEEGVVFVGRPGDEPAALAWFQRVLPTWQVVAEGGVLRAASSPAGLRRLEGARRGARSRWAGLRAADGPTGAEPFTFAVDLAAVRRLLGAAAPSVSRVPGAGRLFGAPLVHALEHGTSLRGCLSGGETLRFEAVVDATLRGSPHDALVPASPATPIAAAADALATVRLERSLRAVLQQPADLLGEEAGLAVQGFTSIADAFAGAGGSFADDLLGGLAEPFELHVLPAPDRVGATPLVLPAFVLVGRVVDAGVEPRLRRAFELFATIANAERAQRGQRPFVLRRFDGGAARGVAAEPPSFRGEPPEPVEQQLTPTLAFADGFVAIASDRAAAEVALAAAAGEGAAASGGDRVTIAGPALAELVRSNHDVLALTRAFDEGESLPRAREFFTTFAAVLDVVRQFEVTLVSGPESTTLSLALRRTTGGAR